MRATGRRRSDGASTESDRGRVGLAQGSSEGRVHLAIAHLHAGEYELARATAQTARGYDYALMSDNSPATTRG